MGDHSRSYKIKCAPNQLNCSPMMCLFIERSLLCTIHKSRTRRGIPRGYPVSRPIWIDRLISIVRIIVIPIASIIGWSLCSDNDHESSIDHQSYEQEEVKAYFNAGVYGSREREAKDEVRYMRGRTAKKRSVVRSLSIMIAMAYCNIHKYGTAS